MHLFEKECSEQVIEGRAGHTLQRRLYLDVASSKSRALDELTEVSCMLFLVVLSLELFFIHRDDSTFFPEHTHLQSVCHTASNT